MIGAVFARLPDLVFAYGLLHLVKDAIRVGRWIGRRTQRAKRG